MGGVGVQRSGPSITESTSDLTGSLDAPNCLVPGTAGIVQPCSELSIRSRMREVGRHEQSSGRASMPGMSVTGGRQRKSWHIPSADSKVAAREDNQKHTESVFVQNKE